MTGALSFFLTSQVNLLANIYADHFLDESLKVIGNSFFRLLLECILFWAKWFPKDVQMNDTKFKQTYDSLVKMGVKFPEQINYFKPKKPRNQDSKQSIKEEIKQDIKEENRFEVILEGINTQKELVKCFLEDEHGFDNESMQKYSFI